MTPEILEAIDQQIQASKAHFWTPPGTRVCVCVLELESGFTVTADVTLPANIEFNADLARKLAFDMAAAKLAEHEAYRQATSGPRIELPNAKQVQLLNGHGRS